MRQLDSFSYQCGVVDAFCEVISAGVKSLALSHPMERQEELDEFLPYAEEIAARYGVQCYVDDAPLVTDLFPADACQGKYLILFYRDNYTLEEYLRLKARKADLTAERAYFGGNRTRIAREFGRLLSYGAETVERMMEQNGDRELV